MSILKIHFLQKFYYAKYLEKFHTFKNKLHIILISFNKQLIIPYFQKP